MEGSLNCPFCDAAPHPWGEFLKARYYAMLWMRDEMGYDNERIAYNLSMDEMQVYLILSSDPNLLFPESKKRDNHE